MKVYAFVPAKSSSERINNKNMRVLNGKRLYVRALEILLQCKEIDEIFLDTDSEEMYKAVDYLPIKFMKRDEGFATNATDGHQLFLNEVNSFNDADIYVQLLCTSPFIKPETVDRAISEIKSGKYDSAIMMKKDKIYFWENNHPIYDINHIPNSKDLPDTIMESMGLYVSTKESAIKTKRRYGANPYLIFGNLEELIDINNYEDLQFAETYARGVTREESKRFQLVRHLISSPILSDCIDDLNCKSQGVIKYGDVINGWKSNIANAKIFGRAKTLKLRQLKDGELFEGIYNALYSYDEVVENDVIVVENELKDYAYFGDLNARMAIRSGASGAVIDGATRDLLATQYLNFPIFAREYNAVDVRRRATLDYINKPINIQGVIVNPGDLIFVDECAMVVIYKETANIVLEKALQSVANEGSIANDILSNRKVESILKDRGSF